LSCKMEQTRNIDVKKQRNLTITETFHLCVKGISHRMLRSVLTLVVVVLAVAFFMFLLSENSFVAATAKGVGSEVSKQRFAATLLDRMFNAPTSLVLCQRLGNAFLSSQERLDEFAAVAHYEAKSVKTLAEMCSREQMYLRFFDKMPVGKRIVLVGKSRGRQILEVLADPKERVAFTDKIKPMPDVSVPGGVAGFSVFLDSFPAYGKELQTFTAAWTNSVGAYSQACNKMTGGDSIDVWLGGANAEQLKEWQALAATYGFKLTQDQIELVHKQLKLAMRKQDIAQILSAADKQELWLKVFQDRTRTPMDDKMLRLDDARVVPLFDGKFDRGQLAEIPAAMLYENRLTKLEHRLAGRVETTGNEQTLSGRQIFLLIISFVVCMVGIANAMLMSITERFREIATMKCLGATDRYVLVQFMMEAALQGIVGGVFGMIIGFIIALMKNTAGYGLYVFAYWPGPQLAVNAAISLVVGVLLAVLASIYPSWAASRMAPMEAMRIE